MSTRFFKFIVIHKSLRTVFIMKDVLFTSRRFENIHFDVGSSISDKISSRCLLLFARSRYTTGELKISRKLFAKRCSAD